MMNVMTLIKEMLYEVLCLKFFRFMRQLLKLSSKCEDHIFILFHIDSDNQETS